MVYFSIIRHRSLTSLFEPFSQRAHINTESFMKESRQFTYFVLERHLNTQSVSALSHQYLSWDTRKHLARLMNGKNDS